MRPRPSRWCSGLRWASVDCGEIKAGVTMRIILVADLQLVHGGIDTADPRESRSILGELSELDRPFVGVGCFVRCTIAIELIGYARRYA
jgi:hypothetical protein